MTITVNRRRIELDPDGNCTPRRLLALVKRPWPDHILIEDVSGEALRHVRVDRVMRLRGGERFRTERYE